MSGFSFHKGERITSRRILSSLFTQGKIIHSHPYRILYKVSLGGNYPASVAFSVPKRLFKRAVDRNLLKRRTREAYRLNKPYFYSHLHTLGCQVQLVILYQHNSIMDFQAMQDALRRGIEKLLQEIPRIH